MPVFYIQFTLMNRNVALCDELQQLVSRGDDYLIDHKNWHKKIPRRSREFTV